MRLAEARRKRGWTQAHVAELLGCSQPHVCAMERARGPAIPGHAMMGRIHTVFEGEVEPNDFYDLGQLSLELEAA